MIVSPGDDYVRVIAGRMMSRQSGLLLLCVFALSGCASPVFTEEDLGQTREVDVGTGFSICLQPGHGWGTPRLEGAAIRYLRQRQEEGNDLDVFLFRAEHEGEFSIVIPASPDRGVDQDFIMLVRVRGGGGVEVESQRDRDWWLDGGRSGDR